jgi:hypothetical protein
MRFNIQCVMWAMADSSGHCHVSFRLNSLDTWPACLRRTDMTMGKPTLSALFMGTGDNSSIKPCARGMNFAIDKVENNTAFLYTDDKPMAVLIPPVSDEAWFYACMLCGEGKATCVHCSLIASTSRLAITSHWLQGATLTISSPEVADGFRPGLRVTHAYLNPAASGSHTLGWKVTVAATGETTEGECTYPPSKEVGFDDPEGWPIDPVYSWSLTNKATDQTVEIARFVFNRC